MSKIREWIAGFVARVVPSVLAQLPNALTGMRLLSVFVLYGTLFIPANLGAWIAAVVFGLAAGTDFLDGWLARRYNAQSAWGTVLDPIADKLLVITALLVLILRDIISAPDIAAMNVFFQLSLLAGIIIIWREIFIAGLREYLSLSGVEVPVTQWAKLKTLLQMVALTALLAMPALEQLVTGSWIFMLFVLWVAALLSITTAVGYIRASFRHLRQAPSKAKTTAPQKPAGAKARKVSMRK